MALRLPPSETAQLTLDDNYAVTLTAVAVAKKALTNCDKLLGKRFSVCLSTTAKEKKKQGLNCGVPEVVVYSGLCRTFSTGGAAHGDNTLLEKPLPALVIICLKHQAKSTAEALETNPYFKDTRAVVWLEEEASKVMW